MAPALSSSSEVKVLWGQETDRVAGEEKLWTTLSTSRGLCGIVPLVCAWCPLWSAETFELISPGK